MQIHTEAKDAYNILVGILDVTKLLGKSSYTQEGNIKLYLRTIGCGTGRNSLDLTAVWNFLNNRVLHEI